MGTLTIIIEEKEQYAGYFLLEITFLEKGVQSSIKLKNPNNKKIEDHLDAYFEEYINKPFDTAIAKASIEIIEKYGLDLYCQIFEKFENILEEAEFKNREIEIKIIGQSPSFQSIYWESMRKNLTGLPFSLKHTIYRQSKKILSEELISKITHPNINLLIVTARPKLENDVNYRTIQRPLIELINHSNLPIKPYILRPGSFEAFIEHLNSVGPDYYHIIHFDLHGELYGFYEYNEIFEDVIKATDLENHLSFITKERFRQAKKPFVLFESNEYQLSKFIKNSNSYKGFVPVEASQLAQTIKSFNIPIVILNACNSARQNSTYKETSLGNILVKNGISLAIAMRFSITVTASEIFMRHLYKAIFNKIPIKKSLSIARRELYNNKKRIAKYNKEINLDDWFLPVLYQSRDVEIKLRAFDNNERIHFEIPNNKNGDHEDIQNEFFGRDLDILRIERFFAYKSKIVHIQGVTGIGKTSLIKHLKNWWLKTYFINYFFYFDYDKKFYTYGDIIDCMAIKVFPKDEYEKISPHDQEIKTRTIVEKLRSISFTLAFDNVDLKYQGNAKEGNEFYKKELKKLEKLKSFLKIEGCSILIGSRKRENWVFDYSSKVNHLNLNELDSFAASNLVETTIAKMDLSVNKLIKDFNFIRLLRILKGYPLALKNVLPYLKFMTPEQITHNLLNFPLHISSDRFINGLDGIFQSIEKSYSELSQSSQNLLIYLAFFTGHINTFFPIIKRFFQASKYHNRKFNFSTWPLKIHTYWINREPTTNLSQRLNNLIEEGLAYGLIEEVESQIFPTFKTRYIVLPPELCFFLRYQLSKKDKLNKTIKRAFVDYYWIRHNFYFEYIARDSQTQRPDGLTIVEYEYENLISALILGMSFNKPRLYQLVVIRTINEYLDIKQFFREQIYVNELILKEFNEMGLSKLMRKNPIIYIGLLNYLGKAYFKLKIYDKANETLELIGNFLESNSRIKKEDKVFALGSFFQSLGATSFSQGEDLKKSHKLYSKALKIFKENGLSNEEASLYLNMGTHAFMSRSFDLASEYWLEAVKIYESLNQQEGVAKAKQNLFSVALEQNNFEKAEKYLNEARLIYERYMAYEYLAETYNLEGILFTKKAKIGEGSVYEALPFFEAALDIYEQLGMYSKQATVFFNLAKAFSGIDNKKSQAYFQKASEIIQ